MQRRSSGAGKSRSPLLVSTTKGKAWQRTRPSAHRHPAAVVGEHLHLVVARPVGHPLQLGDARTRPSSTTFSRSFGRSMSLLSSSSMSSTRGRSAGSSAVPSGPSLM